MKLNVTQDEAQIILNALGAVSPSGGGGRIHRLILSIQAQTDLEIDDYASVAMQITAERELEIGRTWG